MSIWLSRSGLKADFENYRKRVARESAEAEARGRGELARALLPVLDNLERALAAASRSIASRTEPPRRTGVRLVYEELAGVLRGAGDRELLARPARRSTPTGTRR